MHVDIIAEFTVAPLGDSSLIYGSQKVHMSLLKTVFVSFSYAINWYLFLAVIYLIPEDYSVVFEVVWRFASLR